MTNAELLLLKAEMANDPAALGYAGKDDLQVAAILNAVPPSPATLDRLSIPSQEIIQAIDLAAWGAVTADQRSYLALLLGAGEPVSIVGQVKANLGAIFPAGGSTGATRSRILALVSRNATRVETVLSKHGAVVSHLDVASARRAV